MVPNPTDREPRPPYNRELPKEYWQGLKQPDQYAQYRAQHPIPPATKPINGWVVCLAIALVGLGAVLLSRQHPSLPKPAAFSDAPAVAVVAPTPVPPVLAPVKTVPIVPRAELVTGPLTTEGQPMLSGHQYWVTMPESDGRHLLVNYKGWVDHACNLPRQPKGGANNAAYTEAATGHTWIWTLPATGPSVPQWIDP